MAYLRAFVVLLLLVFLSACSSSGGTTATAQNSCEAIELSSDFSNASRSKAMTLCQAAEPSCRYVAPLSCICKKDADCVCGGSDAKCVSM